MESEKNHKSPKWKVQLPYQRKEVTKDEVSSTCRI